MGKLREDENFNSSTFKCEIPPTFFTDNQFKATPHKEKI